MSDFSTQLQMMMRQMMQPQSPMQMQDDMMQRAQQRPPGQPTAMQDWQNLIKPPAATPNYQSIPHTSDGTPDVMAIKPQMAPGAMDNVMSLFGAKNIPQGLSAASKIVGK